jgi:hypothetical protein
MLIRLAIGTGGVAQEVECLPSKCEALSSNPSNTINRPQNKPTGLGMREGHNDREEKGGGEERRQGREERAKLAETSRAARPSSGHPASWQWLSVTSWAGAWGWRSRGRGACKTLESLFI